MPDFMKNTVILLPVYKPEDGLVDLCRQLEGFRVVVVDSGSGKKYDDLFRKASEYGEVLRLDGKGGRGTALKHGLRHILVNAAYAEAEYIVTAGEENRAEDISALAKKTASKGGLVLGVRKGGGSAASKFGKIFTDLVFRIGAGKGVGDSLTGVRGFSREQAEKYAELPGERFEFEMNMLFSAVEEKTKITDIDIPWKKDSFRFHPVADTVRLYWSIFMESRTLKYIFSSGVAFIIDYVIFTLLLDVFTALFTVLPFPIEDWSFLPATIVAWIVSSMTNFFMNRNFVFRSNVSLKIALPEYYGLAAVVFLMKTLILTLMVKVFRIPEKIAKLVAEVVFFVSNYFIQKLFIFKKKEK